MAYANNPVPNKLNLIFKNSEELNSWVYSMVTTGSATQTELAEILNVSRQRVQQRLKAYDPDYTTCGIKNPIQMLQVAKTCSSWSMLAAKTKLSLGAVKVAATAIDKYDSLDRLFRLRKYQKKKADREKYLNKLRHAAKVLGHTPTTEDMTLGRAGLSSASTYQQKFGSVAAAQKAAGLPFNSKGGRRQFSRQDLINQLQDFYLTQGRNPTYNDIATKNHFTASIGQFLNEFKKLTVAYKEAGLSYKQRPFRGGPTKFTRQQAIANLQRAAKRKKGTPSATDMSKRKYGLYSVTIFRRIFGSVTAAQDAAGLPRNFIDHRYD